MRPSVDPSALSGSPCGSSGTSKVPFACVMLAPCPEFASDDCPCCGVRACPPDFRCAAAPDSPPRTASPARIVEEAIPDAPKPDVATTKITSVMNSAAAVVAATFVLENNLVRDVAREYFVIFYFCSFLYWGSVYLGSSSSNVLRGV